MTTWRCIATTEDNNDQSKTCSSCHSWYTTNHSDTISYWMCPIHQLFYYLNFPGKKKYMLFFLDDAFVWGSFLNMWWLQCTTILVFPKTPKLSWCAKLIYYNVSEHYMHLVCIHLAHSQTKHDTDVKLTLVLLSQKLVQAHSGQTWVTMLAGVLSMLESPHCKYHHYMQASRIS